MKYLKAQRSDFCVAQIFSNALSSFYVLMALLRNTIPRNLSTVVFLPLRISFCHFPNFSKINKTLVKSTSKLFWRIMMSFHFYSVSLPNDFWAMNENTFFFLLQKKVRNGLQQHNNVWMSCTKIIRMNTN